MSAVGIPNLVTSDMVKNGVAIIDVGISRVKDPTKKSGYKIVGDVDFDNVSKKAWEVIEEIESLGGMTKAVKAGVPKLKIEESATKKQAKVDSGSRVVVGVNKFKNPNECVLATMSCKISFILLLLFYSIRYLSLFVNSFLLFFLDHYC